MIALKVYFLNIVYLITQLIVLLTVKTPKYLVYDNACQLMRHMHKKANTNPSTRFDNIKNVKYVVDRLHIKGHTQKWCLKICHPDLFDDLNGTSTVVCEQINFWLGRLKHIMKHMNATRFNFFLYINLNEHNILKSTGNFNNSILIKYKSCKKLLIVIKTCQ